MKEDQLTIFYDGKCPLCSLEVDKLKRHDQHNKIRLIDLHQDNFNNNFPYINTDKALAILHGEYQGKVLLALDVTHRAWTLVGRGMLVAPLQWPVFKQISHAVYLQLAKHRYSISSFIHKRFGIGNAIGIKSCDQGTCYEKPNNSHHRR